MLTSFFGSRFSGGAVHRVLSFRHFLGNRLLTLLSNLFTNLNLTDMECCYKLFRRLILEKLTLEENRSPRRRSGAASS